MLGPIPFAPEDIFISDDEEQVFDGSEAISTDLGRTAEQLQSMTRELSNAPDALLTIESEMKRLKDELYGEQGIGGIARELQAIQKALPQAFGESNRNTSINSAQYQGSMTQQHDVTGEQRNHASRKPGHVDKEKLRKALEEAITKKSEELEPIENKRKKTAFDAFSDLLLVMIIGFVCLYFGTEWFPKYVDDTILPYLLNGLGPLADEDEGYEL